ncbi:hypothetical protein K353_03453 [Kitasatospora sp. SolWspMP-SS2h]|uniref:hypothetical protein n=1 Tax=Kitasatospora sp. SolWspMP-SS2h TaxID=1305729 RepID=UPI000DB9A3B0|nr:hypothetical protein [Kitasatospora sp. SolWspMP-SS2h]RAJ39965.1 hypothetical protein K353_03453 [Kitasatospora sp. SolWspMP-SS2h]
MSPRTPADLVKDLLQPSLDERRIALHDVYLLDCLSQVQEALESTRWDRIGPLLDDLVAAALALRHSVGEEAATGEESARDGLVIQVLVSAYGQSHRAARALYPARHLDAALALALVGRSTTLDALPGPVGVVSVPAEESPAAVTAVSVPIERLPPCAPAFSVAAEAAPAAG